MAGAFSFAAAGIILLILGGVGLRSLDHAPVKNIQLVYTLLAAGALFVGLAIWVAIARLRYYGNLRGYADAGSSGSSSTDGLSSGYIDSGGCGHSGDGGDGDCGADGGGGH